MSSFASARQFAVPGEVFDVGEDALDLLLVGWRRIAVAEEFSRDEAGLLDTRADFEGDVARAASAAFSHLQERDFGGTALPERYANGEPDQPERDEGGIAGSEF